MSLKAASSLLLLKPDLVSHPVVLKLVLRELCTLGLEIRGVSQMKLSASDAEKLYGTHKGKFFYPRLIRHVTSGQVMALHVVGDVRTVLGSSRLWPLTHEPTLRQQFALSDVRNIAHNSDSEHAENELAIFQPFNSPNLDISQFQL